MLQCGFVRANLALPIAAASYSVETTTIQNAGTSNAGTANAGAGAGIRTHVGIRRQIYSLLPLTTRPPLRDRATGVAPWGPRHAQISASPGFVNTPSRPFALPLAGGLRAW